MKASPAFGRRRLLKKHGLYRFCPASFLIREIQLSWLPNSIFFSADRRGFESKSVTNTRATTDKNDPFLYMGFKHGKKWVDKNGAKCNMGFGRMSENTWPPTLRGPTMTPKVLEKIGRAKIGLAKIGQIRTAKTGLAISSGGARSRLQVHFPGGNQAQVPSRSREVWSHLPFTRRFLASNSCPGYGLTSGNRWAGRRCVEPHGPEFGC